MRDILAGIAVLVGIVLFAIYVLPWLELAAYGVMLLLGAAGLVLIAGLLLWHFIRWNWEI